MFHAQQLHAVQTKGGRGASAALSALLGVMERRIWDCGLGPGGCVPAGRGYAGHLRWLYAAGGM